MSAYGYRRSRRNRRRRFHAGVDFAAPRGTVIRTVRSGVVSHVPRDRERGNGFGGYGNAVVVHHPDEGLWTLYAHLDTVTVAVGDRLEAGEAIGTAGRTSNRRFPRMAPHLHLEVRHATSDGDAPFPGIYRWNNVNPRCWLSRHGLHYGRRGELLERPSAIHRRCRGR